jgi:formamidopyrimidine-DNA glycosylase
MQALAERLDTALAGATLTGVTPLGFSALKTVLPAPDSLVGRRLDGVGRQGKYLVLDFGGPRVLVHLSQAGRLDLEEPPKSTRTRAPVVRLRFLVPDDSVEQGAERGAIEGGVVERAVFVREHGTERKAAWWVLDEGDVGPLATLGPDADTEEFAELVRTSDDRRRVHTVLRDQHTVAGVGRGYADDALWRARLSPYATLASLDADARQRLVDAVRAVLADGLEHERRRVGGLSQPRLGEHFEVHGRHGTPCPRCGETMRRVSYESYEITYCPACQTGGQVLADRRLSRLVK